jgi:hypothetical protein
MPPKNPKNNGQSRKPSNKNINPRGSLTSNRRSARLNAAPDTTPETNLRKGSTAKGTDTNNNNVVSSTRLSTPVDEDPQSHGEGLLKEIQDLQRQLQEEKRESSPPESDDIVYTYVDKNRLLNRGTTVQTSRTSEMIPKPKGSVGETGFSLIAAMKLDKHNPKDKTLYNDILVSTELFPNNSGMTALTFLNAPGVCPYARNRCWYRS